MMMHPSPFCCNYPTPSLEKSITVDYIKKKPPPMFLISNLKNKYSPLIAIVRGNLGHHCGL